MAPWRVVEVKLLPEFSMQVRFADGLVGQVDMAEFLAGDLAGTVFSPLQDVSFFAQVHVFDGVVTWPGEIDLAPDTMYREIARAGVYRLPRWKRKAA